MIYSTLWLRFPSFKLYLDTFIFFPLILEGDHLLKFCARDGKQQSVVETAESNSERNDVFCGEPWAGGGEGRESFTVPRNSDSNGRDAESGGEF